MRQQDNSITGQQDRKTRDRTVSQKADSMLLRLSSLHLPPPKKKKKKKKKKEKREREKERKREREKERERMIALMVERRKKPAQVLTAQGEGRSYTATYCRLHGGNMSKIPLVSDAEYLC
jgi:hypothetical protein